MERPRDSMLYCTAPLPEASSVPTRVAEQPGTEDKGRSSVRHVRNRHHSLPRLPCIKSAEIVRDAALSRMTRAEGNHTRVRYMVAEQSVRLACDSRASAREWHVYC